MDGRHNAFNLEDLQEEQKNIDTIITSLLNYSTNSVLDSGDLKQKRNSVSAAAGLTSNATPQAKKTRGRPPKQNNLSSSPVSTATAQNPTVTELKPSLGTVIECLKRLSDQNKNLLNFVETLSEDIKKSNVSENISSAENTDDHGNTVQPKTSVSIVEERLEKLEQNINSNILICRGPTVESLIEESTRDSTQPNLERLKGDVCKAVGGDNVTSMDICNIQVSVFGKDKKKVRVDCRNPSAKLLLVRQARRKRPEGIYVSEFLTPNKLSIFYNLRQLKKQHPDKIQAVFTRGGNLFYRRRDSDREIRVNSLDDLTGIVAGAETSSSVADGN